MTQHMRPAQPDYLAAIPAPAGATRLEAWEQDQRGWWRWVTLATRDIAGVTVFVGGEQRQDGTLDRLALHVDGPMVGPVVIDADGVSAFVAACVDAADALNRAAA